MSSIVIGTAGHVDHGKTALIRALTGTDTDRLAEEKRRGLTIEIGFASLELPDGGRAGIVDVPGHERFVPNMLAGAGGMDAVLLVVAANEGFMPQTREHLAILSLLGLRAGIVVLTKADLVEPLQLEAAADEARESLRGSFLESSPLLAVSCRTGAGIEALRGAIFELAHTAAPKPLSLPFRLPVDRVFTAEGFGVVATGTILEGQLALGDELALYPAGTPVKLRGIETCGAPVKTVFAGQRAALNLAGVKKGALTRGDILSPPGQPQGGRMLDVRLTVLAGSPQAVANQSRLHFYHCARELLCKAVLLDRDALAAGESCFAQLRFSEPVSAKNGDRFVVRFYSPMFTIGGGVVLNASPSKQKRGRPEALAALERRFSGTPEERLLQELCDAARRFPSPALLGALTNLSPEECAAALRALTLRGEAVALSPQRYTSRVLLEETARRAAALFRVHEAPVSRAELCQKLLPACEPAPAGLVLEQLLARGVLARRGTLLALAGCEPAATPTALLRARLLAFYESAGLCPPTTEEVAVSLNAPPAACRAAAEQLLREGLLLPVAPRLTPHRLCFEQAVEAVRCYLAAHSGITLAQCRDLLGISRKNTQLLLEYCDRKKITKKQGDSRSLCP